MSEFLAAIVGALVGSFGAYFLSARGDLFKSRLTRRLDWCEKAMAQLLASAGDLTDAIAAHQSGVPEHQRDLAWAKALGAIGALRRLEVEAEAFAVETSAEAITEAVHDVIATTTVAEKFRLIGGIRDSTRMYAIALKLIYHAASRLAADVRREMGEPLAPREWRLYDREIRELRDELSKSHDADPSSGDAQ